jgi:hypothetical protein
LILQGERDQTSPNITKHHQTSPNITRMHQQHASPGCISSMQHLDASAGRTCCTSIGGFSQVVSFERLL